MSYLSKDMATWVHSRCHRIMIVAVLGIACVASASIANAQDLTDAPGDEELIISDTPSRSFDGSAPGNDELDEQLAALFERIPGLEDVTASTSAGVVVLTGVVQDPEDRDAAVRIANRFEGVAAVQNRIELDRRLASRLTSGTERLRDGSLDFIAALPSLIVAIAAVLAFWFVGRWLAAWHGLYARIARNAFLRALLQRTTVAVFAVAGLVTALFIVNAGGLLGSIAGALGIVGLAIGFATRDTVENFIASILLSIRQPFARRDHVLIGDQEGKVMRLSSRATVLMSLDGNHIRIPNSTVFKSTITNYSRNPRRRFDFDVGVDTDLDLSVAIGVALDTLNELDGVLDDPPPACVVKKLGDSSVVLATYAWVDQRVADYFSVRSQALQAVKVAFDEQGIVMPEPIYNVNLRRQATPRKKSGTDPASPVSEEKPNEARLTAPIDEQIESDTQRGGQEDLLSSAARQE